jgi:REP element-mobilizing transposase RayT
MAVRDCWQVLPTHFPYLRLDAMVIMPDHVHAVLWIVRGKSFGEGKPAPITRVVGVWKSFAARRINAIRGVIGQPVWQRNYYEHIVRDHDSLIRIRSYIRNNPKCWRA